MIHSNATLKPISSVVTALGTESFEDEVLDFLCESYGVEVYSIFRMKCGMPQFIGGASILGEHPVHKFYGRHSLWGQASFDFTRAQRALQTYGNAMITRTEPGTLEDRDLRKTLMHFGIVDRVMMCGSISEDIYGISLLRSEQVGRFRNSALNDLGSAAGILLAAAARHTSLYWDRPATSNGLDSIELIELRLREANWGMSERELQVSARILHGVSALGIAHDLGLREDTIATYRKRMYQRLQISSRHELLRKYLALL